MDRYALEGTLGLTSYCQICENIRKTNGCEGCVGIVNIFRPDKDTPPSKFKSIYKVRKENKKMVVTIIGRLSKKKEMDEIKAFWEQCGAVVNSPGDPEVQKKPLVDIQSTWIEKIEEADLIVAVPKDVALTANGDSKYILEFGESTSYEMAIARRFNKPILFG